MSLLEKPAKALKPDGADTGRRRASKEFRREQLINATIDSLAKRGFAATTLADVADGAGLSRGIVNFHFESKEKLFVETLQFMSDEYAAHWKQALARAGTRPDQQLHKLIVADLDRIICNPRKVAAWFAFWAEAKSRPAYQKLCWERDDDYVGTLTAVCVRIRDEGAYTLDPEKVGTAIYAMQEGLWLRLMLSGKDYRREDALSAALATLGALFPNHFNPDGTPNKRHEA